MKIITIIPILNPCDNFFKSNIPILKNQNIENDIVLINSGSKIKDDINYKVIDIDKNNFNHANTRNIALEFDADYYLFMTQDAMPYDNMLMQSLLNPLEKNPNTVISYARQLPYENAHITEQFARNKNYPKKSILKSKKDIVSLGIKTYFSSNSCAMYKANYFKTSKGFKKDLNFGEDMEFTARAILNEKEVAYCAEAKVYHSHIYSISSLYCRYFYIGNFFKQNSWIQKSLENANSTEKTGVSQAIEELKFVTTNQPTAFFKSIIFILTKYIGYKAGKYF